MNLPKHKILIVDDERFFVNVLLGLLKPAYHTAVAFNGAQAIAEAASDPSPDLILLDIMMPGMDGYDVCRALKKNEKTRDIPVIFLTVRSDVDDEEKGFQLGAVDYITKPISPPILQARVKTHLTLKQAHGNIAKYNHQLEEMVAERTRDLVVQIAERQKAEDQLRHLANYDQLTTLPNRILFKDRLAQEIKQARRNKTALSLLLIDLDRFKHINDTLGHHHGDLLLQQVASRLTHCVRDADTVARLGGDEFTITLLDITDKRAAGVVAEKVIAAFEQPFSLDKNEVHVSASIGITNFPDDADDIHTMMKNADMAMYQAKTQGRNAYSYYTPGMTARARERMNIEKDLRRALSANQLILHYQPIIQLASGNPVGAEALLRWHHPQQGIILPSEFISVAEESDLILSIGEWVLQTACEQANRWRSNGLEAFHLAINFSARQCNYNRSCLPIIENILKTTGFPANQLSLEITENLLLDATEETMVTLKDLNAMDINLSIDDFGTGFSSLGYLRQFPINTLKIDKSFVRDITVDSGDAALVTAIIAMAKAMNLNVIAEGVETEEQCHFLLAQDCGLTQGYYFSKPLPADQLEAFFHSHRPIGNVAHGPSLTS